MLKNSAFEQPGRQQRRGRFATAAPVVGAIVLAGLGALLLAADVQIIHFGHGLRSSMNTSVVRGLMGTSQKRIKAPVPKLSTHENNHRRTTSLALPNGDCYIRPALKPTTPLAPVFMASYPGSGDKIWWTLVQALTGVLTGDEHNDQSWSAAITIKTHHPHIQGNPTIAETSNENFPRVVLLLRHPADAIPGFHNFLYEYERGLPDHSTRAPLSAWQEFRDDNFAEQIKAWEDHTSYWMDRYANPADRLIVTFEGMVDDTWGPQVALALNQFLRLTPGVDPIADDSAECVWHKIIQYKVVARPRSTAMSIKKEPAGSAPLLSDLSKKAAAAAVAKAQEEADLELTTAREEVGASPVSTASDESSSTQQDPSPTDDNSNPPNLLTDQRRRRLDAVPDNSDFHARTGFKKERPYTSEQLVLMQATFNRLRERYQDPDLNDVLDLYSERVGLLQKHSLGIGFEPHRSGRSSREQEQPRQAERKAKVAPPAPVPVHVDRSDHQQHGLARKDT